jgi:HTH-type transcriptional regulator/antitoxin HigA
MMDVRAIRTEADYQWALREIEPYFTDQPAHGTPEAERFDVLAALLKAYEDEHHSIPEADPVDVLQYAITSMGRSQAELADIFGSQSRASESGLNDMAVGSTS